MTAAEYRASLTEKQFQASVIDLANAERWLSYFTYRSSHSPAGFPDIVLVRGDRVIFAELKTEKGKVTPDQRIWFRALLDSGKVEVYLWRPSMWDQVVRILQQ